MLTSKEYILQLAEAMPPAMAYREDMSLDE